MLITWMLYCFLVFLLQFTAISESKSSTVCAGVSSCNTEHQLNCSESEYVNITGGSYGYESDCSIQITVDTCIQSEITRCCIENNTKCYKRFNITDLQLQCFQKSACRFRGKTNPEKNACTGISINSYSKIAYSCINRGTTSTATTTAKPNATSKMSNTGTTSTATTTAKPNATSKMSNTDTGGIIGAVVATIVVVAIILVVVFIIMKRKKKQSARENPLNERKGSTLPIINNIAGDRGTNGYSEVDLGDMSTSQTKTPSSNNDRPNLVTEPTTYAEYNHLGDSNSVKTKSSNANYNQIQINKSGEDNYQHFQNPGKPKPQTDAEYNHIGAVNNMMDAGDYNSLGNISKLEVVDNDNYSHIGGIQRDVPNSDYDLSNYSHIGEVQRDVANNVPDLGGAGIQDGQQGPSDVRRNDYAQVNKKRK